MHDTLYVALSSLQLVVTRRGDGRYLHACVFTTGVGGYPTPCEEVRTHDGDGVVLHVLFCSTSCLYHDASSTSSPQHTVGLLELFYGVYEKDPDRCLDALVDMGVLVPSADRQAVRRTAEFFLSSFQDRLKAQKEVGV